MMPRIREAMGLRDAFYGLRDMVELDEAYISKATRKGKNLTVQVLQNEGS